MMSELRNLKKKPRQTLRIGKVGSMDIALTNKELSRAIMRYKHFFR